MTSALSSSNGLLSPEEAASAPHGPVDQSIPSQRKNRAAEDA